MNWFEGEIQKAVQTAISEKKLFVVFVKDDSEESKKIDELWQTEEVMQICTDDLCIAIYLTLGSVGAEQFGNIYPIMCVPAIFFINNDGIPLAILPFMEKDELIVKLRETFEAFQKEKDAKAQAQVSVLRPEITGNNSNVAAAEAQSTSVLDNETSESETREAKKMRAEELLEKSKALKAQKEKEEAKEKERKRRDEGRELSQAKRDLAERQAKQLADEIAKRRAEEKAARERVRQQIKQDRVDKEARYEAERKSREKEQQEKAALKKHEKETAENTAKKDSNVTRIQFRLPNGSTASKVFNSDDKFSLVQEHATKMLVSHLPCVRLTTVFPKYEYTEEDHQKSLRDLSLTPSASIIVSPGIKATPSPSSMNPFNILMSVLAPFIAIITWFLSLFSSTPSSANDAPPTENTQPATSEASAGDDDKHTREATLRRRNIGTSGSNIRRLYDDKPDDEDNATWNGNSTQQM